MAKRQPRVKVGRRGFLQGVALGGVAAIATPVPGEAQSTAATETAPDPKQPRPAGHDAPSQEFTAREEGITYSSCGGDYMVDVMRSLGIEYFAATPGNTFMGVHEAVINYGMLSNPSLRSITT